MGNGLRLSDTMASRTKRTTTYDAECVIQPIYTGGDVALGRGGRILATCLGEEALLTDLGTGDLLARVEGVCTLKIVTCRIHKLTPLEEHRMAKS